MNLKFRKKFNVGSGDMDINYRLTKIAMAKFFQETFAMYCAKNNVAAFDLCKQNIVWVIADLHIEFSEYMPYWSEEFDVEIWISEKTVLRTYVDFKLYYKNNLIAKGDSCWYLLDMQSRRPIKSIDILKDFQICKEKVFPNFEKQLYRIEGEKIAEKEHIVTVRDLDFNYHVNNLSYLWLALETVPTEILKLYSADSYCVKFVKEAYLSDLLVCELYEKDKSFTARIYNKKDMSDVCFVFSKYSDKKLFGRNPREAGVIF
ncbi:hypothetical protein IJG14_04095 [bacterium]|nr:hypothetical protein [bacterium]